MQIRVSRRDFAFAARRCRCQEAADAGSDVLITVKVWPTGLGACVEEDEEEEEEEDDEEEEEEDGGGGGGGG